MTSATPRTAVMVALALLLSVGGVRADGFEELKARAQKPPGEPEAALQLARELRRSGLYDEAIGAARSAFAKARGREIVSRLRLEIARNYMAQREQKRALAECARLEKLSRVRHHVCRAEAQLLRRRGSLALPEAKAALSEEARHYDALVAKGRALGQLGRSAEAEAALVAAAEVEPDAPAAHRYLAELYRRGSEEQKAIAALQRARAAAPRDPDVLVLLAKTLGPGAQAIAALEQAVAVRPGDAEAQAWLGKLHLEASNLDAAERALERALKLDPKNADSHALLGRVHLRRGEPDKALASAKRALGIVVNHAAAKLLEAMALAERGDIDLAIVAFEAAYGLARLEPRPLVEAARACLQGDRPTTAQAFAVRATQDFPEWGPAWVVLGDVARALGETDKARQSYRKALASKGPVDEAAVRRKLGELK